MKLLPKQENAVYYLNDTETTHILYGGGAGGGKSALGCLWLIQNCQRFEGSRWLMGRSKLKTLKETTLKTFFEVSTKLGINDQFTYVTNQGITFKNGSEIILKDLFFYPSDPEFESLGSLEITGAFIDECSQLVYKAWQIVGSRCRYKLNVWDRYGQPTADMEVIEEDSDGQAVKWKNPQGETTAGLIPKILGSCNPSKNWTYKKFYKPSTTQSLPKGFAFIQALPKDNKHLPKAYIDQLLSLDETSRQRLYHGNWEFDNDPSALINYNAIQYYFDPHHIDQKGEHYMTIDVARMGADKTVMRVWYGWVCVDRYAIAKSGLVEVSRKAKELMNRHNISLSNVVADEDGVGGGLVDFMAIDGFLNGSKALNGENFANLKSQCSWKMANKICKREVGEVSNDEAVQQLVIEEMEQVKQKDIDKDGRVAIIPKEQVKANIGRSPDEWDSIMMRYYFELRPKHFVF